MKLLPQTATFEVDIDDDQLARFPRDGRPNTTDAPRRAFANELQIAPIPHEEPRPRPWIDEGREAFAAREVFRVS